MDTRYPIPDTRYPIPDTRSAGTIPADSPLQRWAKWARCSVGPWLGVHDQYRPRPLHVPEDYATTAPLTELPLISLVTPSFNQGKFLERTIRSVLDQNYPRLEYVIQDGGSTDETADILVRYRPRFHHCESRKDRGQAHAINLGFQHVSGDILAYLNSDDLLLPGALPYIADFFAAHPEVDVVYGHRIVIDDQDAEVGRWIMPPHDEAAFLWNDYVPQETLFWRRRIWDRIGGAFDESYHFALDWDLLLRFRAAGARFARLPRFLGAFRFHPQQKSSAGLEKKRLPEQNRLLERCHGRRVSRWERRWRVLFFLGKHIAWHRLYQAGMLRF